MGRRRYAGIRVIKVYIRDTTGVWRAIPNVRATVVRGKVENIIASSYDKIEGSPANLLQRQEIDLRLLEDGTKLD